MSLFTKGTRMGAKLTVTQVQDIRTMYASRAYTQGDLSREFGVSIIQIGRIVRGEVWQNLGPLPPTKAEMQESAARVLAGLRADKPEALAQEILKEIMPDNPLEEKE